MEADDGGRTRDLRLGKPTLYQLSYVRAGAILERLTTSQKSPQVFRGSCVLRVEAAERVASREDAGVMDGPPRQARSQDGFRATVDPHIGRPSSRRLYR